jgi:hypothetical protein
LLHRRPYPPKWKSGNIATEGSVPVRGDRKYPLSIRDNARQVLGHIESIPLVLQDFDEPYGHMGATLTDAILQQGIDYTTVVEPRVNNILTTYPEAKATTQF